MGFSSRNAYDPNIEYTDSNGKQSQVIALHPDTVASLTGGGTAVDREFRTVDYTANTAGTGYSTGDLIVRADMYDVTPSTPTLLATVWFNATTGSAISAPTQANLTYLGTQNAALETTQQLVKAAAQTLATNSPTLGQKTSAGSVPVVLASDEALPLPTGAATGAKQDTGNMSLASLDSKLPVKGQAAAAGSLPVVLSTDGPFATNFGLQADTAATTDTGSFSFVALVKRGLQNWTTLLGRVPALGQALKAASLPVTLASDQGNVTVAEAQGTPTEVTAVSASTTIATLLAAAAGRRRFIALNPSTSTGKVGLSTNAAATFASCAIVLSAGDMWVEALAAPSAWYCIMDTSTASVPVQTVS